MQQIVPSRPPASRARGGSPNGPTAEPASPSAAVGAALRALYAPVAERPLPIYYGPVLGRLFLKLSR